jgi:hypothetical protein
MCSSVQQCAAMCSSVQQCAAVCSNVQQCAAVCSNVQQCAAMCSGVQQCAAVCSNVQQCHDIMEYDICTDVSQVTAASTFTAADATFTATRRSDLLQAEERKFISHHFSPYLRTYSCTNQTSAHYVTSGNQQTYILHADSWRNSLPTFFFVISNAHKYFSGPLYNPVKLYRLTPTHTQPERATSFTNSSRSSNFHTHVTHDGCVGLGVR